MRKIEIPGSVNNPGHYSPGMVSKGMLYISGQLPVDPVTRTIPEGFRTQVIQALENVNLVLESAGAKKSDVVMCRAYLPQVELWNEFNEIYKEWFASHKPARVIVPSGPLHYGAMVEIEAFAELREDI